MRKILAGLMVAVGTCGAAAGTARADFLVVPNAFANVDAPFNNAIPFSLGSFGVPNGRYQQVFAAAQFAGVGPVLITEIAFRPDAISGNPFNTVLPDVQINLSTTAAAQDALSLTFAANVGANDTVVRARGPLPLSSLDVAGPGNTRAFDIVIALTTPFLYDPAAGNLLLDVRNFGGGTTTFFDATDFNPAGMGDGTSRVSTFTIGNVNSPVAQFLDTAGLVTRFTVAAVPEPASLALLAAGAVGLVGYRRRAG